MGGSGETGIKLLVRVRKNSGILACDGRGTDKKAGAAPAPEPGEVVAPAMSTAKGHQANVNAEAPPNWVQCDTCMKWRKLPNGINPKDLPNSWRCGDNTWNTAQASCLFPEESYKTTTLIHEPPFRLLRKMESGRFVQ